MKPLRTRLPLEKRKVIKKSLAPFLLRLLVAVPAFLVFFWIIDAIAAGDDTTASLMKARETTILLIMIALSSGWVVMPVIYEVLYFLNYFYDMDDKKLTIRKGILVKKEAVLPFSKITDVYVDQDAFDVGLGLYDVHISTPTVASGEFAHIDGVSKKNAMILRDMILERIHSEDES